MGTYMRKKQKPLTERPVTLDDVDAAFRRLLDAVQRVEPLDHDAHRDAAGILTQAVDNYSAIMHRALPHIPRRTQEQKLLFKTELFFLRVIQSWRVCNALNRQGKRCRLRAVQGKYRCRYHGGLSTGAVTEEGRRRIGEASRERMLAYWRQKRGE